MLIYSSLLLALFACTAVTQDVYGYFYGACDPATADRCNARGQSAFCAAYATIDRKNPVDVCLSLHGYKCTCPSNSRSSVGYRMTTRQGYNCGCYLKT
ncbi:hypothetical protein P3342_013210 [Pyrenophora teres f. teres]|uniref:Uncharacterized protein n=1 Tax=Pyrenophora teres f. teres TaxID=97479 RepID=A0A6S6WHM5_9PLEO|nr:hypothetical protein P3342_013210 [Pyrenophora teres f. teres]CAE7218137.1 hypothetical protein PTTW11_10997 [Pyrenophora teres f. teres]